MGFRNIQENLENEFSLFAGMKDEDGWFTLEYLNSGLFLTARPGDENPIIEKNCFPTCPGNFQLQISIFKKVFLVHPSRYLIFLTDFSTQCCRVVCISVQLN